MRLMTWLRERLYGVEQMARRGRRRGRGFQSRPALRFRPRLEVLEDRCIPAALDPTAFASLGTLNLQNTSSNQFYLNTTGPNPTLMDSNGNVLFTGVVYNEGTAASPNNVAVFDFDSITASNVTIYAYGANPVALLSRGDFTLGSSVIQEFTDYSGINGVGGLTGSAAGPGGAPGPNGDNGTGNLLDGNGPGGGESAVFSNSSYGGGGGGFGGAGGAGSNTGFGGGEGGEAYGDLYKLLQGGSSGGMNGSENLWAGGGGGAVELGAVGTITLNGGNINMDGGSGALSGNLSAGNGGGSGGAVFVHGNSVNLSGDTISAKGGGGGAVFFGSFYGDGGGGGGGGRILIQYGSGGYSNTAPNSTFDVQGGGGGPGGGVNGAPGVVNIEQVDAPMVTTEPTRQTVAAGSNVSFTAAADGTPTPTVQWQYSTDGINWTDLSDGGNVSGATSNTLTLASVTTAMSGNEYRAVFSNGVGTSTNTSAATLTVIVIPVDDWIGPNGSGGSGNWDAGSNWSLGYAPGMNGHNRVIANINTSGAATVTIQNGDNIQVQSVASGSNDTLAFAFGSLTVTSGASTLNGALSLGGGTLTASGSGVSLTANGSTYGTNYNGANLFADNGATLSLPNLTSLQPNNNTFAANGAGSVLDVSNLTTLHNPDLHIIALSGGEVNLNSLSSLTGSVNVSMIDGESSKVLDSSLTTISGGFTVKTDGTDAQLTNAWTSFTNSSFSLVGGSFSLGVTDADNSSLYVSNGATLSLPNLVSYTPLFSTFGASSKGVLDVSALTTATVGSSGGSGTWFINANYGGEVNLKNLTSLNDSNGFVNITDTGNSELLDSSLASVNNATVNTDGTDTQLANAWTSFTNGSFTLNGGSLSLTGVADADGSSLIVNNGASLALPNLASYTAGTSNQFEANGTGSVLDLRNLTTQKINGFFGWSIDALNGGEINLNSLTSLSATGNNQLVINDFGTLLDSSLSTLNGVRAEINGDRQAANSWKQFTNGRLLLYSVSYTLPNLTDIDGSSLQVGFVNAFNTQFSASLVLPNLVSYTADNTYFTTDTSGSVLDVSALTTLSLNGNWNIDNVGKMKLTGLTSLSSVPGVGTISITDQGTLLDSNVATLDGVQATIYYDSQVGNSWQQFTNVTTANGNINGSLLLEVGSFDFSKLAEFSASNLDLYQATLSIAGNFSNSQSVVIDNYSKLILGGAYTQTTTGTLNIYINGTPASGNFSQIIVGGAAALAGAFKVNLQYPPSDGQDFRVMTFGSVSGAFNTVNIPTYNGIQYFAVPPNPEITPTTLDLVTNNTAPIITLNPSSQTVTAGSNVSFTAYAVGNPLPTTVQWQVSTDGGTTWTDLSDGGNVSGAATNTLTLTSVTAAMNSYEYRADFTNSIGSTTTTAATLSVDYAPTVTTNPISQTVTVGGNVSFTAAANGNPTPTVQWQVSIDGGTTFTAISGATNTTLTLSSVTAAMNGYEYEAVFTNSVGAATSSAATLTVDYAPSLTNNPTSQTVTAGQNATFTAAANGNPTPTVQWQVSTDGGTTFTAIIGATNTTLTLTSVTAAMNGYEYEAVFTNSLGSVATTAATLSVDYTPTVTTNPANQTVTAGQNATFTAAANGNPTPSAQWYVSTDGGATFTAISGATNTTLTLTGVTAAMNGYEYEAVFTNSVGSATTSAALLTVDYPPSVTTNPTSQTVTAGNNATFTAAASGNPTPTVQWQVSTDGGSTWNAISGATSTTLTLTSVTAAMNGYEYEAVFTNSIGSVTTAAATLTVDYAPSVTTNPASQTVTAGNNATFTAAASGNPTPTVQWQVSTDGGTTFSNISGATSTTLTLSSVTAAMNGYEYEAVFTNSVGNVTTTAATLTVEYAPSVTTNPASQTVTAGSNVSFTAAANGNPTPTVQWQVSIDGGTTFTAISGATSTSLTLNSVTAAMNGYEYEAVFTNSVGSATTSTAILTVDYAPTVTTNPTNLTVTAGNNATFTAAASGNPTPTVQWQVSTDGGSTWTAISGATSTTLTLTSVTAAMNGYEYEAVFTNSIGSVTTSAATLTVDYAPTVTTNPVSPTVLVGSNVSFTAAANGNPTPTVQWQVSTDNGTTWSNLSDGGNVSGAATNTLTLTSVTTAMNGYLYQAVFTNSVGTATTSIATLTVNASSGGPVDVSSDVSVTRSGFSYNFALQEFVQTITITNTSGNTLFGSLALQLTNLSSNATLANTSLGSPNNTDPRNPYIDFVSPSGSLAAGQSITVMLYFKDPTFQAITYGTQVWQNLS